MLRLIQRLHHNQDVDMAQLLICFQGIFWIVYILMCHICMQAVAYDGSPIQVIGDIDIYLVIRT
jgi:hypothetical protein